jgi:hypothetical protein
MEMMAEAEPDIAICYNTLTVISHLISEGWSPGGMRLTANICAASSGLLNMFTNIRNAQTSVADVAFPSFTEES